MSKLISLSVRIDYDELVKYICNSMTNEELVDFIMDIDGIVSNWDFTLELCEIFRKLKEEFEEEEDCIGEESND